MVVPLADRVVEVIGDRGAGSTPRYRYGSGCIVRGRTVLTAAHVVAGAQAVTVRRLDKVILAARLDPRFVGGGAAADLALLEIDDARIDLPPMELGRVDRDSPTAAPVDGCHVIGYPQFKDTARGARETTDAYGHVPVLAGLVSGLLTVEVTATPRPLPPASAALGESEWSGISGAPLIAGGCLIGVVSEHAPREGPSAITAVPLTALAHDPAHSTWGPGVSNAGEWWRRLGVPGREGLRLLPERAARTEPAYRATIREIHGRTPQLLDREAELADIAAFATGAPGYRWLIGGAWAGKTALLAEACTAARPAGVDVAAYFLSRREADADSNRFLAAVVPQLACLLEEDTPAPSLEGFRALWSRAAAAAGQQGRHLLLVVDGLDEDLRPAGVPSVAALLPAEATAGAHVLVTSRPYPELPGDVPAGHPLRQPPVALNPSAHARDLADRAQQEIYDLLHREDQDLAADLLGTLAAAAGPLSVSDLTALARGGQLASPAVTHQVRRLVTEKAARALQPVGPAAGRRYQFAHSSLLEQAQADELLGDPGYRQQVHQWADQWRDAGWPTGAGAGGTPPTPRYLLDSYPSTLTDEPRRLAALAGDVGWVVAALLAAGVDQVLADLRTARSAAAGPGPAAALLTVIRSQAPSLRPPLPPADQRGYVLRLIGQQAAELSEEGLAAGAGDLLRAMPGPVLAPVWTTRRATGGLLAELHEHGSDVMAVAGTPGGGIASCWSDGHLRVWDPDRPDVAPVEPGGHRGNLWAVASLPDGRVVFAGNDARLEMWDGVTPGGGVTVLGQGQLRALAALPDGRVVSGDERGSLLIWDPDRPGASPVELGRQRGDVRVLALLPGGRVVSGGMTGRVEIRDTTAPGRDPVELGRAEAVPLALAGLAALADGQVASGARDGRVALWNPADPDAGSVELGHHGTFLASLAAMRDGRVASGGADGRVLVWDPAAPGQDPLLLGRHDGGVWALGVLPDGRVVSGGGDSRVRVWDAASATSVTPGLDNDRTDEEVRALAMLPGGRVVFDGPFRRVLARDPARPAAAPVDLGGFDGGLWALGVLPDGRVVSGDSAGHLAVLDPARPAAAPVAVGRGPWVGSLAVLPGGRVATAGGGMLLIWDPAAPGAAPLDLGDRDHPVTDVAVLADGRVAAGGPDGRLHLWDPVPGARPVELGRHGQKIWALAALPGGGLASAGSDGRIRVWDPALPGAGPREIGAPEHQITWVVALSDGRLASGGRDGRLRLWDVSDGSQVAEAECSVRAMASAPVRPGEDHLLIAHRGRGVSLWSVRTSALA